MNQLTEAPAANCCSNRAALSACDASPRQSAPRLAGKDVPPLDVEQLRRRCMGRLDLVDRLLTSFERRFPVELLEIEQSLIAQDVPRLLQQVHQLKGATGNISAPALHQIIQNMEAALRADQLTVAGECLGQLQMEWERFVEFKGSVCFS